jgi:hypothetical protein
MPRRPKRSTLETIAPVLLVVGYFAAPFLTASPAQFLMVTCAGSFAVVAYLLLTRRWWPAVMVVLISAQPALNLIDHERTSHFGHELVAGLGWAAAAIFGASQIRKAFERDKERRRRMTAGT